MKTDKLDPFKIPRVVGHGGSTEKLGAMVGTPMSPRVIELIGAGNPFPDASCFDVHGDWIHSYRIWTNHANATYQAKNTGHITVARSVADPGVSFQVRQLIVNQDGMFQRIEALVNCRSDDPATVRDWEAEVVCYDAAQCPIPGLDLAVSGRVSDEQVEMTVNGTDETHAINGPLLCQWLILDAVQRGHRRCRPFTTLEHGLKLKAGQTLTPGEPPLFESAVDGGVLDLTVQRGRGLLPWDYWRDSNGRVLYAFSGTVMVILDSEAPRKTDRLIEELVQGGHHYEY